MGKVRLDFVDSYEIMNFNNPEHERIINTIVGADAVIQREFPLFYSAFETARTTPFTAPSTFSYIDTIRVFEISYDKQQKKLSVDFNATLTRPSDSFIVYIYDKDMKFFERVIFPPGIQHINHSLTFNNVSLARGEKLDLYMECPYLATTEAGRVLNGGRTALKVNYGDYDLFGDMTVTHPRKKNITPLPDEIAIIYGRSGTGDYYYPSGRKNGNQKVFLEIEGKVQFKSGFSFKKLVSANALMLNGSKGSIVYQNNDSVKVYAQDGLSGFRWAFHKDWRNEIPESVQYGNRDYIFDMAILFMCNETGDYTHRLTVSSRGQKGPGVEIIPQLRLYWGCIAAGSRVTMANGREQAIESVKIGDKVDNGHGGAATVTNVFKGHENIIHRLVAENGAELLATDTHPILTNQGFVPVRSLTGKHQLRFRNGETPLIRFCYEDKYSGAVYNLDLDSSDTFVCNGFLVGTNMKQSDMSVYQDRAMSVDPRMHAEFERLQTHLMGMK